MLQLFFAPNRGSSLRSACAVSGGRTWREAGGRDDGIKGLFLPLPCSHKLTYSNSTSFKAFTTLRQRPAGSCNLDTSSATCSSFFLVRLEWEQKNDYRESKTRRRRERRSDEVVGCPESLGCFWPCARWSEPCGWAQQQVSEEAGWNQAEGETRTVPPH